MVFSSTLFIFIFLPITLIGYYLLKGSARNYWLLFVSLIFFGWSQPNYLWIILLNIAINYSAAMLIDDLNKLKKQVLIAAVVANVAILYYFKYFNFTVNTINKVFSRGIKIEDIILPIGISFFTFQGLSYVIDVYRKDVEAQKNIFKVGLYIVLFPQLIAGPIVRYKDVAKEVEHRSVSIDDFSAGVERFIIGLGKKAIIANTMAVTADAIWSNEPYRNLCLVAWVGSIAYTLQIFFDFSGYSDMAIGLGRMFGFHFNENFDLPYISKSITEFWRRWHISLSSWFRDYVYIPLGGNRKHVYLNLFIVFLLTGIWHGAAWNFIAWGVFNGLLILTERVLKNYNRKKEAAVSKVSSEKEKKHSVNSIFKNIILSIYTLLVVNFGWVLFRAPSIKNAILYVMVMLGLKKPIEPGFTVGWYLDRWTVLVMILGAVFSSSLPRNIAKLFKEKMPKGLFDAVKYILLIVLFLVAMTRIVSGTYNPFIYFQF